MTRTLTFREVMGTWGLAQAKAQFSEVVAKAISEGPQEIANGGKDAVVVVSKVVVSKEEWMERAELRRESKQNVAEFLLKSPLRDSGLKIGRLNLTPRNAVSSVYLIDTDVISQIAQPKPHAAAMHWLADTAVDHLHLSVATIIEIRSESSCWLPADGSRNSKVGCERICQQCIEGVNRWQWCCRFRG